MNELIIEIDQINAMEVPERPFPLPRGIMSIYTIEQVAEQEGCKRHQVAYWCRNNQVKKFGTAYVMSMEDIEAFRKRRGKGWKKGLSRKE